MVKSILKFRTKAPKSRQVISPQHQPVRTTVLGGYTMIEILVAVAILAVLAAILVPASSGFLQRGIGAKSMAQQRQIAAAILTQASDNNARLRSFVGGATVDSRDFWNAALVRAGLLPDPKIFFCPGFRSAEPRFNYAGSNWPWSGYGMAAFYPDGQPGSRVPGTNADGQAISLVDFRLSSVAQPSRQILLADSYATTSGGRQTFRIPPNDPREGIHLRHAGRANVVFLDGHGESLDAAALRALTSNRVALFDDKQQLIR